MDEAKSDFLTWKIATFSGGVASRYFFFSHDLFSFSLQLVSLKIFRSNHLITPDRGTKKKPVVFLLNTVRSFILFSDDKIWNKIT